MGRRKSSGIADRLSEPQARQDHVERLGTKLGPIFHELSDDFAWLSLWAEEPDNRVLPELCDDDELRASLGTLVDNAVVATEFARDWRNRRVGHRDLDLKKRYRELESELNEPDTPPRTPPMGKPKIQAQKGSTDINARSISQGIATGTAIGTLGNGHFTSRVIGWLSRMICQQSL